MRHINEIIVHHSATNPTQDFGVKEFDAWHRQRGFDCIGYHFVIRRDGTVEIGRDINRSGAHTKGHNARSIGICVVGGVSEYDDELAENNFNPEQFDALETLLRALKADYGVEKISMHKDYAKTACPAFNVRDFVEERGI